MIKRSGGLCNPLYTICLKQTLIGCLSNKILCDLEILYEKCLSSLCRQDPFAGVALTACKTKIEFQIKKKTKNK